MRRSRNSITGEAGGVTLTVTAMISSFLLFSLIALVVDGGLVYLERRSVVNAAQSAALALAKECAEKPSTCAYSNLATQFASANSDDGLTRVTEICIKGMTPTGSPCAPVNGSRLDCAALPSQGKNFVRIRTQSQSADNPNGIDSFFSGGSESQLNACAQVIWGNASSASVFAPFAVSICEWARQQALPRVLAEFTTNFGVNDCSYTFTDLSGVQFTKNGINGWAALDLTSSTLPAEARAAVNCPNPAVDAPAALRIGQQLRQIARDQSSPNYCGDGNLASKMPFWLNQILYIPLVSTEKLSGNATIHIIEAFAAYRLLGFSLSKGNGSSSDQGGTYPVGQWCPKNTNCIYGEFITTLSPASEINQNPGVPNVGLQAIELI
jgi:hypothetical protein